MTIREEIIAKLREACSRTQWAVVSVEFDMLEIKRIIDDLHFAEFAHQHLEGGKVKIEDAVMPTHDDFVNDPPWDKIKQWALLSGFVDDGYGDPKCTEWDDLRRFAARVVGQEWPKVQDR